MLDNALWLAGIVTEAVVIGLLLYRRVWRVLPVFCIYCVWDLLSNVGVYASRNLIDKYLLIYLFQSTIDFALQFCLIVELTWSVLRPLRAFLPRSSLPVVGVIIVLLGALIWPLSAISWHTNISTNYILLMHMQEDFSILRILFFLLLAGCSQLLAIGWRDRELQVVTGLFFYSFFGLAVAILKTQQALIGQYHILNRFVVASYLCSLLYWVFCFAQKEEKRRDFTPQMQKFLLALAGTARTSRVTVMESVGKKPGKPKSM